MAGVRVLHWNGKDIPEELRELPAGMYVVEAVETAPALTAERNPIAAGELGERIFTVIDKLAGDEFDGPEQTLVSGEGAELAGASPAHLLPASAKRALGLRIYHQGQRPIVK